VLLLEDIDLSNKDTTMCRAELDVFGAQLGVLMMKKQMGLYTSREIKSGVRTFKLDYQAGNHMLAEVSWLRLWSYGKLRTGRESGWYCGITYGPEHYLLMYCRFNGPQDVREKLSTLLWYHMQAMRTLAIGSG